MVKDCLPGAVHQHPPDPLHPGSSGGQVLHFSPAKNYAINSTADFTLDSSGPLLFFLSKRSVFKFGQNLDFLSYAIHCWPPLLSRDGFEPARSKPFNLRTHNSPPLNLLWISTLAFMNISSTDQAGVSPFQGGELEKGHFEVVCLLPTLENVLQPILNHFPLRFFHFLHQHIWGGHLQVKVLAWRKTWHPQNQIDWSTSAIKERFFLN